MSSKNSLMSAAEEMVLTPGGYRPRSKVQQVDPGHHLRSQHGRMFLVHTASGHLVRDLGLSLKSTPPMQSRLFRQFLSLQKSASREFTDPAPLLNNGWVAFAEWINTAHQPLSEFIGEWTVPPPPQTDSGQTIFLFIGLQNNHFILQPVLQWGPSAAGGGSKWTIANWYAGGDSSNTVYSELVDVKPGDVLRAGIRLISQDNRSFRYSASFEGFTSLELDRDDVIELFLANVVLETYNVTDPSNYPATPQTQMRNLELVTGASLTFPSQSVQPDWQLVPNQPITGRPRSIIDSGGKTISLNYGHPGS